MDNKWVTVGIIIGILVVIFVLFVFFSNSGSRNKGGLSEKEIVRDLNIMQAEVDEFAVSLKSGALSQKRVNDFLDGIEEQIGHEVIAIFEIDDESDNVKRSADAIDSDLKNSGNVILYSGDVLKIEVYLKDKSLEQDGMPSAFTKVLIN